MSDLGLTERGSGDVDPTGGRGVQGFSPGKDFDKIYLRKVGLKPVYMFFTNFFKILHPAVNRFILIQ